MYTIYNIDTSLVLIDAEYTDAVHLGKFANQHSK